MQKRKLHSTRGGSSLGFELVQKSNDLSPCLPVLRISVRAKLQIRFPANSVQLLLRLYVCSFRQTRTIQATGFLLRRSNGVK